TIAGLREGMTEKEAVSMINSLYSSFGAGTGPQIAAFGANAADPHHDTDDTPLKRGDCVVLDIFTPLNRYWCDMTRTVFFGEPSDEAKAAYEAVLKANRAAISLVRPGVELSGLDKLARMVLEESCLSKYFTHRLGHCIGIDCHEPPDVSSVSPAIARPGMIFSIEPGVYLPGKFGIRIEDLVMVTEDGCEVLNKHPKELTIIK
ncbi:MAG: M24 family metallopeptidase, partial [Firmicutes bacterium]|nr:M24 family metallopeptidase [Bacillota bacterium]